VAAGVVTFAGEKAGYGNLVEVSHGNGLITRYGHNQSLAVGVGHTVARGDTVAYVGSTGRSNRPARALRSAQERPARSTR
jgi:murein DD-endopeptidase MepM/ murein hydrolase activator NlpD